MGSAINCTATPTHAQVSAAIAEMDAMRKRMDDRLMACRKVEQFGQFAKLDDAANYLAKLLGFKDYKTLLNHATDKEQRIIELLLGPNGKTIYKMLEARMNSE